MRTCVPPFRGEFGLKLRYHVPAVAALPRPVTVCIEPGDEALYPDADHIIVDPNDDDRRRDMHAKDAVFVAHWRAELERRYPGCRIAMPERRQDWPLKRFVPVPVADYGLQSDVVVCPRWRSYQPSKNWGRWVDLVIGLQSRGLHVQAAGNAAASDRAVARWCPTTWGWPRPLDATIGLLLRSRLVIATDAGLAHLAVLCGRPLLLISYRGRVAPGEHQPGDAWWPIRMDEYYHAANHAGSPIEVVDGWEDPAVVIEQALDMTKVAV